MAKSSAMISTISYNSFDFLKDKLNYLVKIGELNYFEFIKHLPDTDDRKLHYHVFMIPNKAQDYNQLRNCFRESCSVHIDKKINKFIKFDYPLLVSKTHFNFNFFKDKKIMLVNKTRKYGDWYWYSIHDKDYLRAKGLTRNIHYCDDDIYSYDKDMHRNLLEINPLRDFCQMGDNQIMSYLVDCVQNNVSIGDVLAEGYIPLGKVTYAINYYFQVKDSFVYSERKNELNELKEFSKELKKQKIRDNYVKSQFDFVKVVTEKDDLFE